MSDRQGQEANLNPAFVSAASFQKSQEGRSLAFFPGGTRFALISGLIVLVLVLVLLRTGSLQLFGSSGDYVPETVGSMSEILLDAPRGDIVDVNGIPLAVSDALDQIELVSTQMTNEQLNRFLLDLALLFDQYHCDFENPMLKWLDVPYELRDQNLLHYKGSLRFVFRQNAEDILDWQTDRNLFNLIEEERALTERQKRRVARSDPDELFDYLLFDYFQIEPDRASGSRLYSDGEAFVIMQLRYLLLENNWLFVSRQPVVLAEAAPAALAARLIEQNDRYPGIAVTKVYKRRYTDDSRYAGHTVGYMGRISASEYNRLKASGYAIDSLIGKTGVEASAERYLRSETGTVTLSSWYGEGAANPVTFPGTTSVEPKAGHEIKLTLDMNLQKIAREELERKIMEFRGSQHKNRSMEAPGGSVIVMDAKTGAILVNANYPDFDPQDFLSQDKDPDAAARVAALLTDNRYRPLLNRGIAETYTPGSTFKPVTGMAALEANVISPGKNTLICRGIQEIGGFTWRCYGWHGDIGLTRAMVTSCNLYFFQIGVATGIDRISQMAESLGLGQMPGLDIAGEAAGVLPSRAVKQQLNALAEDQTWFIADTCQTSIGQFYNSYTMVQMARAIAGLATNRLPTPHFIKEVVSSDGELILAEQIQWTELGFDPANVAALRNSMVGLSKERSNRTGVLFHDFPVSVACKTGTAESYNEKMESISNSVFVCYAPANDPEIVIAHAISDGAYGEYSADISYRIMCEYFGVEPVHAHMGNYDSYRGR